MCPFAVFGRSFKATETDKGDVSLACKVRAAFQRSDRTSIKRCGFQGARDDGSKSQESTRSTPADLWRAYPCSSRLHQCSTRLQLPKRICHPNGSIQKSKQLCSVFTHKQETQRARNRFTYPWRSCIAARFRRALTGAWRLGCRNRQFPRTSKQQVRRRLCSLFS